MTWFKSSKEKLLRSGSPKRSIRVSNGLIPNAHILTHAGGDAIPADKSAQELNIVTGGGQEFVRAFAGQTGAS